MVESLRAICSLLLLNRWFLDRCYEDGPQHQVEEVSSSWWPQHSRVYTRWASWGKGLCPSHSSHYPGHLAGYTLCHRFFCVQFLATLLVMQDLVPRPEIAPVPLAVEVRSLNHWIAREVPCHCFCFFPFTESRYSKFPIATLYLEKWGQPTVK